MLMLLCVCECKFTFAAFSRQTDNIFLLLSLCSHFGFFVLFSKRGGSLEPSLSGESVLVGKVFITGVN